MDKSNQKKFDQLNMTYGKARAKLGKSILFKLVKDTRQDLCYRCKESIEDIDNFSIEHKDAWLDSEDPKGKFFDLENVAFSHLSCNISARRNAPRRSLCGTRTSYKYGCRCNKCTEAQRIYMSTYDRKR